MAPIDDGHRGSEGARSPLHGKGPVIRSERNLVGVVLEAVGPRRPQNSTVLGFKAQARRRLRAAADGGGNISKKAARASRGRSATLKEVSFIDSPATSNA